MLQIPTYESVKDIEPIIDVDDELQQALILMDTFTDEPNNDDEVERDLTEALHMLNAYYKHPLLLENNEISYEAGAAGRTHGGLRSWLREKATQLALKSVPFIMQKATQAINAIDELSAEISSLIKNKLTFDNFINKRFDSLDKKIEKYEEYQTGNIYVNRAPTYEACEIHSMSMEFFAWPWFELFFGKDAERYRYKHLASSISFIPYGVLVDHFQTEVYENPDMTPAERKAKWRELEKLYLPFKVYDNEFLEKGTYWFRQSHIFTTAFYYIDYTLAQVCAHQYWIRNREDSKKAWESYHNLCKQGGSKSFLELVEFAGLDNPFVDGTIKKISKHLFEFLDNFDQSKLM